MAGSSTPQLQALYDTKESPNTSHNWSYDEDTKQLPPRVIDGTIRRNNTYITDTTKSATGLSIHRWHREDFVFGTLRIYSFKRSRAD